MTVAELIKELQRYHGDVEVYLNDDAFGDCAVSTDMLVFKSAWCRDYDFEMGTTRNLEIPNVLVIG